MIVSYPKLSFNRRLEDTIERACRVPATAHIKNLPDRILALPPIPHPNVDEVFRWRTLFFNTGRIKDIHIVFAEVISGVEAGIP